MYPIEKKSDVLGRFEEFPAMAGRQTGCSLQTFQTDGGGEFLSSEFSFVLRLKGILQRITCAYTPQQNELAESMNQTI